MTARKIRNPLGCVHWLKDQRCKPALLGAAALAFWPITALARSLVHYPDRAVEEGGFRLRRGEGETVVRRLRVMPAKCSPRDEQDAIVTRILIVDDHPLFRRGLRALLENHAGW